MVDHNLVLETGDGHAGLLCSHHIVFPNIDDLLREKCHRRCVLLHLLVKVGQLASTKWNPVSTTRGTKISSRPAGTPSPMFRVSGSANEPPLRAWGWNLLRDRHEGGSEVF